MTTFSTKAKTIIFSTLIMCNKCSTVSDRTGFLEIIHAANDYKVTHNTDDSALSNKIQEQKKVPQKIAPANDIKPNQLLLQELPSMRAIDRVNSWNNINTDYMPSHNNKFSTSNDCSQSSKYNIAANNNSLVQPNVASTSKVIRDQKRAFLPPPPPPAPVKLDISSNRNIYNLQSKQNRRTVPIKSLPEVNVSHIDELKMRIRPRLDALESSNSNYENKHTQNDPTSTSTNYSRHHNYNIAANDNSSVQPNLASTNKNQYNSLPYASAAKQNNGSHLLDDLAQQLKQAIASRNQKQGNDNHLPATPPVTEYNESNRSVSGRSMQDIKEILSQVYINRFMSNPQSEMSYIASSNSSNDDDDDVGTEYELHHSGPDSNTDYFSSEYDDFDDELDNNISNNNDFGNELYNEVNHHNAVYSGSDNNISNIDDGSTSTSVNSTTYYNNSNSTNTNNTQASAQNQLTAESNADGNGDLPPPSDQDMLQNAINSNILNEPQKNAEITDISSKSIHHNMMHHTLLSATTFKNFISRKIASNDNNALIRPIGASESNNIYKYAFECKYLYSTTTIPHIHGINQTTATGILLNLKYQLSNKLTIGTFYLPSTAYYKLYDPGNNNTINTLVTNHCIGVYTSYAITPATYLSNQLSLAVSIIDDRSNAAKDSTTNTYPYCLVMDSFLSHKINIGTTKTIAPELGLSYYSSNLYTPYNTGNIDNLSLIIGLKFQHKYKYKNVEFCPSIKVSHTQPIYSNIVSKIQKLSLESMSAPSVDFLRDLQSSFNPNSAIHYSLSVKCGNMRLESGYGVTAYHNIKFNYTHTLFVKVNLFF